MSRCNLRVEPVSLFAAGPPSTWRNICERYEVTSRNVSVQREKLGELNNFKRDGSLDISPDSTSNRHLNNTMCTFVSIETLKNCGFPSCCGNVAMKQGVSNGSHIFLSQC